MMLLPPPPGTCPICAVKHDPTWPHNAQSLYYQYRFYGIRGRWPTWADAAATSADCPSTAEMIFRCIAWRQERRLPPWIRTNRFRLAELLELAHRSFERSLASLAAYHRLRRRP